MLSSNGKILLRDGVFRENRISLVVQRGVLEDAAVCSPLNLREDGQEPYSDKNTLRQNKPATHQSIVSMSSHHAQEHPDEEDEHDKHLDDHSAIAAHDLIVPEISRRTSSKQVRKKITPAKPPPEKKGRKTKTTSNNIGKKGKMSQNILYEHRTRNASMVCVQAAILLHRSFESVSCIDTEELTFRNGFRISNSP